MYLKGNHIILSDILSSAPRSDLITIHSHTPIMLPREVGNTSSPAELDIKYECLLLHESLFYMKFDGPSELTNTTENDLVQGILLPFLAHKCIILLVEHQVNSQNIKVL